MKLNEVNISSSAHDSEPDNKTAARCGGMVLYCRYKQTLQHRPFSAENCILQCVIFFHTPPDHIIYRDAEKLNAN